MRRNKTRLEKCWWAGGTCGDQGQSTYHGHRSYGVPEYQAGCGRPQGAQTSLRNVTLAAAGRTEAVD